MSVAGDGDGAAPCWREADAPVIARDGLPAGCDVAVVGGGLLGAGIAYWLTRRGIGTVLLESRMPGWGASGRNAGLVLWGAGPLERQELLERVLEEEGIDVGYGQVGHLALIATSGLWERVLSESTPSARTPSPRIRALSRDECEDRLGVRIANRFLGGRWFAGGCVIHPLKFLTGLLAAGHRRGLDIVVGCHVRGVEARSRSLVLRSDRGEMRAERAVIAGHCRSAELVPELGCWMRPIRGQMLETEPLPPTFRPAMAVDWGAVYWRQLVDGRVILGGCREVDPEAEETAREGLNPAIQSALEAFLPANFPGIGRPRVRSRWSGIMDVPLDGKPILGRLPGRPGVWVAVGLGGHGLPGSLGAALALAGAIATDDDHPDLSLYEPRRFLPE